MAQNRSPWRGSRWACDAMHMSGPTPRILLHLSETLRRPIDVDDIYFVEAVGHDTLVRLGVLPPSYARYEDPLQRRENARGFDDFDFAPEP